MRKKKKFLEFIEGEVRHALYLQGFDDFSAVKNSSRFVKIRQAPLTNYGPIRGQEGKIRQNPLTDFDGF